MPHNKQVMRKIYLAVHSHTHSDKGRDVVCFWGDARGNRKRRAHSVTREVQEDGEETMGK